jgi:hypothetical protein
MWTVRSRKSQFQRLRKKESLFLGNRIFWLLYIQPLLILAETGKVGTLNGLDLDDTVSCSPSAEPGH